MVTIRPEIAADVPRVRSVNEMAFGQPAEAKLVERLRSAFQLFTPVVVDSAGRPIVGMGLGPLAVVPDRQREGIGSQLVRRGLDILRDRGCPFVVVVGHPEYYPRFGFERASSRGLASQWEGIPEAVFMVVTLDAGAMTVRRQRGPA